MIDATETAAPARARIPFEKLSSRRVQAVLNCLTESTFFYRDDSPELFEYLRKHRAEFLHFFESLFGWDLHVDKKCARLFKRRSFNVALTPKQRALFDLTRRDECLLFMLLLEFHELELARQNVHAEQDDDLLFVFADFVEHAVSRFRKELGDATPGDRDLVGSIGSLFRKIERHRFIALVERKAAGAEDELGGGQTEHLLYAFLPGIHCYDPTRLDRSIFERSFAVAAQAPAEDDPVGGEEA